MKHRIFLRPAADQDTGDQAEYQTQHQSLQMGLRFYRTAAETFQILARVPGMGKRAECRSSYLKGMRMFPMKRFPNHLVFYRCIKDGIEIIRVLHGARDIEAIFTQSAGNGGDAIDPDSEGEVQ